MFDDLSIIKLFVIAIPSAVSLAALGHFILAATVLKKSGWLLSILDDSSPPIKIRAFLLLAAGGFIGIVIFGMHEMLGWLPNSWGRYTEDGEWQTWSWFLSCFIGFFGAYGLIQLILGGIEVSAESRYFSGQMDVEKQRAEYLEELIACQKNKLALQLLIGRLIYEKDKISEEHRRKYESISMDFIRTDQFKRADQENHHLKLHYLEKILSMATKIEANLNK